MGKQYIQSEVKVSPQFRVGYAAGIYDPEINPKTGSKKYSITVIFDKEQDLSLLKKLVKDVAYRKYGDDLPEDLMLPFHNGNKKKHEAYKNKIYVNLSCYALPGIVDDKRKVIGETRESREFYSGCYARATVYATAWEFKGKEGISLRMNNIQKLNDGEPIGGMPSADSEFEAVAAADEDGTADPFDSDLGI